LSEALAAPDDSAQPLPLRILHRVEEGLVDVVLLLMALLPTLEVLARKFLGHGLPSEGTTVQTMTLWVGFLGALLCARDNKHLSLSTSEMLPEGKPRDLAHLFSGTIAAVVTAFLGFASVHLVAAEMDSGKMLVGPIPVWLSEAVMPVCFYLMAFRQALHAHKTWPARAPALLLVTFILLLPVLEKWAPGTFGSMDTALSKHNVGLRMPLVAVVLLALLSGAPIYVGMGGLAMVLFFGNGTPIASVPTETLRLVVSSTLPAIPLLTAAGYLLAEGGSAIRMVNAYRALFYWVPGGVAIMTCLICAVFTTLTGGSGVTILALGGLMYPILREEKYPENFSLGLVTASGSLGLLFFPSLPVILYGVVAGIGDLNQLYIAGLVPGILMILLVCLYGVWTGRRATKDAAIAAAAAPAVPVTPRMKPGAALLAMKWELGLPLVLLVPFLAKLATIVECAALTMVYALIIQVFVTKDIPLPKLPGTLARAATLVGSVLIVLGVALGLTSYLVDAEIPDVVVAWVKNHIHSQFAFLLTLNVMLLVLGSVLEIYSAIVILAPLVAPLGDSYGVDRIHLAIVFLANLELGFLFPPVGLNLFLSSSRFNKPLPTLYKAAFPFLLIMTAAVLLITYVPAMTTGVVKRFDPSYVDTGKPMEDNRVPGPGKKPEPKADDEDP
jgi:tripartite ATP-independent transporter DctM subunit